MNVYYVFIYVRFCSLMCGLVAQGYGAGLVVTGCMFDYEQLKWSLAFTQYIGSFPCAQLPGPVHTARLG